LKNIPILRLKINQLDIMFNRCLIILFIGLTFLVGSCAKGGFKSADEAKKKEQYWIAIEKLKKAYGSEKKDKAKKGQIAEDIGQLLLENRDFLRAEGWFMKARAMGNNSSSVTYGLGEVYKMNENYDKAMVEFQDFLKNNPGDKRGQDQVALMSAVKEWIDHPKSRFVVEKFSRANSTENDYSPMLLKKEAMYFSSDRPGTLSKGGTKFGRTGLNYSDIFVMPRNAAGKGDKKVYTWGTPSPLPEPVSTIMNDGTPCFDEKGQTIYYTQCNGIKGDSVKNCVIMQARRRGKEWADPSVLPFCNDTTVDYGTPALSPDGQRLIFATDLPGGKGKKDLWMSTYVKRGRTWSDPINLGDIINTEGNEMFPYFMDDTTLLYSSDGFVGMGGLDIYRTTGTNPTWTKPENLKYPLNSGGDDFGITYEEDKQSGFFTSNRKGSQGDDIYSFYMTPLIFTLKGVVREEKSGERIRNSKVVLEGRDNNSKIETLTNDTGGYFFKLDKETDYEVYTNKKFYFPSQHKNKTTKGLNFSADLVQDLTIRTSKVELTLNILYDLGSAEIRPDAAKLLDSFSEVLNDIPYVTVEMGSHTDCRASAAYNDSLSTARSNASIKYLISKGIEPERMVGKGYGESQLLNDCGCENGTGKGMDCTEEQHQINRRTTVKVLTYDYKSKNAPTEEQIKQKNPKNKTKAKEKDGE